VKNSPWNPVTLNSIRSTGGWLELWYGLDARLHSHFGYGIDDPNNADLTLVGSRAYNQFYFGNISYDITKSFLAGIELSSWRTLYVGQLPGDSVALRVRDEVRVLSRGDEPHPSRRGTEQCSVLRRRRCFVLRPRATAQAAGHRPTTTSAAAVSPPRN